LTVRGFQSVTRSSRATTSLAVTGAGLAQITSMTCHSASEMLGVLFDI
jgi:hypothetical protein